MEQKLETHRDVFKELMEYHGIGDKYEDFFHEDQDLYIASIFEQYSEVFRKDLKGSENIVKNAKTDKAWAAMMMYEHCGSSQEWTERTIESDKSAGVSRIALDMSMRKGFPREWTERIIIQDSNGLYLHEVFQLNKDDGTKKGWGQELIERDGNINKSQDAINYYKGLMDRGIIKEIDPKIVDAVHNKNRFAETFHIIRTREEYQKNIEIRSWVEDVIKKEKSVYQSMYAHQMYKEFGSPRQWTMEVIENDLLGDKGRYAYKLSGWEKFPRDWAERSIETQKIWDPSYYAFRMCQTGESKPEWGMRVIENAQSGNKSDAAYLMCKERLVDRDWSEGIIENDTNLEKKISAAEMMRLHCGSSREFVDEMVNEWAEKVKDISIIETEDFQWLIEEKYVNYKAGGLDVAWVSKGENNFLKTYVDLNTEEDISVNRGEMTTLYKLQHESNEIKKDFDVMSKYAKALESPFEEITMNKQEYEILQKHGLIKETDSSIENSQKEWKKCELMREEMHETYVEWNKDTNELKFQSQVERECPSFDHSYLKEHWAEDRKVKEIDKLLKEYTEGNEILISGEELRFCEDVGKIQGCEYNRETGVLSGKIFGDKQFEGYELHSGTEGYLLYEPGKYEREIIKNSIVIDTGIDDDCEMSM